MLKFTASTQLINTAGNRLEVRLKNGEEIISNNDYEIKKVFYKESSRMIGALSYELEEMGKEHS